MLRYVVLGLLNEGTPKHGYALMKEYRDRVGVQMSTGSFYRDLQWLVANDFVRVVDRASDSDPRRTPYQITEPGRAEFRRWFTDVTQVTTGGNHEDELSERVAFLADVSPTEAVAVLDQVQDDLWIRTKALERARSVALMDAAKQETHGLPVRAIVLARRLRHIAAELAFLADLRQTYDSWLTDGAAACDSMPASGAKPVARPRAEAKSRRR
ncbi:MAG TPA: PadR family transcriptional regulator [Candidatus Eisenbacteria bacterium]|nr:PadR family transcriptional regulator [Candidatus Eisenbacteria bacterium]